MPPFAGVAAGTFDDIIHLTDMGSVRWQRVVVVVLRLTITLLFVPPVLSKLLQHDRWAHQFVLWGYPAWGAVATTVVEILGLTGLWIPRFATVAIGVLAIVLAGAAFTWLIHGPSSTAAFPGIILMFLAGLARLEATAERPSRILPGRL